MFYKFVSHRLYISWGTPIRHEPSTWKSVYMTLTNGQWPYHHMGCIWWKVKKWEVLRIHVMIVVDLIKRSWMIAAITPVFNLFKLNRLWMMAVCKPAEFSSILQRPMLTNILAWLGYLLFSILRKKFGG